MSEYTLHGEYFESLNGIGFAREGDYWWINTNADSMEPVRIYRREHIFTGKITYWAFDHVGDEGVTLHSVVKVPIVIHEWRRE